MDFSCVLCFLQADSSGKGAIGALDAATFLKKSGLGESVLSQVSSMWTVVRFTTQWATKESLGGSAVLLCMFILNPSFKAQYKAMKIIAVT